MPVDLPPESHRLDPAHHPTPFSADQIREACGPGRRNVYRTQGADGTPRLTVGWFEEGDADGAVSVSAAAHPDGSVAGEPTRIRARWIDLQRHASFPIATTRIETGEAVTPAGRFDCWCYTVEDGDATSRFWFARRLPGPPVLYTTERGGSEVFRSELIALVDPRPA